jgi:hypothetical protein
MSGAGEVGISGSSYKNRMILHRLRSALIRKLSLEGPLILYIGSFPRLIQGVPVIGLYDFLMRNLVLLNFETSLTESAQRLTMRHSTAYLFRRIDPVTIKRKKIFHISDWMTIKLLQYVIMRKDLISSGNKSSVFSIGAFVAQGMIAVFY